MPGFNIHLAIAKQYIKKHDGEITNEIEFLNGSIRPDLSENMIELCENKFETHYGKMGSKNDGKFETDMCKFLQDPKIDIKQDFYKGYLLHLLTDYYFYNYYFNKELLEVIKNKDTFHSDFDCTNKMLEERYGIELSENIKKYTGYKNKNPKYINTEKLIEFIEELSEINLNEQIELINKKSNTKFESEVKNKGRYKKEFTLFYHFTLKLVFCNEIVSKT